MLLLPRCAEMLCSHDNILERQQMAVFTTTHHHTSARSSSLILTSTRDLHLTLTLVNSLTLTSRFPDLCWVKVVLLKNDSALWHSHLPGCFSAVPQVCSAIHLLSWHCHIDHLQRSRGQRGVDKMALNSLKQSCDMLASQVSATANKLLGKYSQSEGSAALQQL